MDFDIDETPAFRDLDAPTMREIDAWIAGTAIEVDEVEVADLDAILAQHEENPWG